MPRGMYDGNLAFLNDYEDRRDKWLASRPKCDRCGEYIQDEYWYEWNDERLCEDCARDALSELRHLID